MLEMKVMSRDGGLDGAKVAASSAVVGAILLAVLGAPAFGQTAALSNPAALNEKAPAVTPRSHPNSSRICGNAGNRQYGH